ncbi:MAG: type IA DNA topoisomerase [Lachnospiraceae bacterium]|nr:type IA DNA topoisomerase [Lachnospiraceae bacterium]
MGKQVFIAEKPSVAREFANALGLDFRSRDGYMEAENTYVTWCVGHLVSMSYPDAYDPSLKRWSLSTIPFIPDSFRYQVIDGVKKQFGIVKKILTDPQVDTIYICTDSGREGEYIYRLVAQEAGVKGKDQKRVWIDSQTKDEILRGIREAKDDKEYDNLGAAAYLRAKEDYLMGINFSRVITLKYGNGIRDFLGQDKCVVAVGRVMTCVLGMVVRREREIRNFVKTPFYRVIGTFSPQGMEDSFQAEWHAVKGSIYFQSPKLYKENGFLKEEDAAALISYLQEGPPEERIPRVSSITHKKETKNPPLLYNLAELQNDCSRFFKISPDQTLQAAQELYEKKLTTYPRTDARVLSSAVAAEIGKNLKGLSRLPMYLPYLKQILESGSYKKIGKTRYTNDKAITDHYAIIPTGDGLSVLPSLSPTTQKVYELIVRRFLAIFYPPAVFDRITLTISLKTEEFTAQVRSCKEKGYLEVMEYSFFKKKEAGAEEEDQEKEDLGLSPETAALLKKNMVLTLRDLQIRRGETSPPKRYNSGSIILAMENAGQLIEEEELREQIKGSGIGTSATRAEILKKLFTNAYLALNKKTQIITPTQMGEMIYDTVDCSVRPLLDPKLTASWEMGLTRVTEGTVSEQEYMAKLSDFIVRRTNFVKESDYRPLLEQRYRETAAFYPEKKTAKASPSGAGKGTGRGRRKKTASGKTEGSKREAAAGKGDET